MKGWEDTGTACSSTGHKSKRSLCKWCSSGDPHPGQFSKLSWPGPSAMRSDLDATFGSSASVICQWDAAAASRCRGQAGLPSTAGSGQE